MNVVEELLERFAVARRGDMEHGELKEKYLQLVLDGERCLRREAENRAYRAAEDLSDLSRLLPEGSQALALCERALATLDGGK